VHYDDAPNACQSSIPFLLPMTGNICASASAGLREWA
jgi:hypothetical protein